MATQILEEGMVLTVEPGLVLPAASGMARQLMVHEEGIVVTPDGSGLLIRRAAPELPVFLSSNSEESPNASTRL